MKGLAEGLGVDPGLVAKERDREVGWGDPRSRIDTRVARDDQRADHAADENCRTIPLHQLHPSGP